MRRGSIRAFAAVVMPAGAGKAAANSPPHCSDGAVSVVSGATVSIYPDCSDPDPGTTKHYALAGPEGQPHNGSREAAPPSMPFVYRLTAGFAGRTVVEHLHRRAPGVRRAARLPRRGRGHGGHVEDASAL